MSAVPWKNANLNDSSSDLFHFITLNESNQQESFLDL